MLIQRNGNRERGSLADIAGNPHSPVVLLDDAFDDGQTEPLALLPAVARWLRHIEALKNLFLVFRIDADAVITGHTLSTAWSPS